MWNLIHTFEAANPGVPLPADLQQWFDKARQRLSHPIHSHPQPPP